MTDSDHAASPDTPDGSFDLVPAKLNYLEEMVFSGFGRGPNCETFVRNVRRRALELGRNDNAWIAHYAIACMDGAAIHWLETLEDSVHHNWQALRKALLSRWATQAHASGVPGPDVTQYVS